MRKVLTVLLLGIVLGLPSFANAAGTPDEQWVPTVPADQSNYQGYRAQESFLQSTEESYLGSWYNNESGTVSVKVCKSTTDANCSASALKLQYSAVLPFCDSSSSPDCVSALTAQDESGTALTVNPIGQFPTSSFQQFTGDPALKLPSGSTAVLVDIPNAPHGGGTKYLVKVALKGQKRANQATFSSPEIQASIYAVKIIDGTFYEVGLNDSPTALPVVDGPLQMGEYAANGKLAATDNGIPRPTCVSSSFTQCAQPYALPQNISFGFSLRLSNPPVGWLHGRMKHPTINLKTAGGITTLDVMGQPIKVPVAASWVTNDKVTPELQSFYAARGWHQNVMFISNSHDAGGFNEDSMKEFLMWLPILSDKAAALPTLWTLNSMPSGQGGDKVSSCLSQSDNVAGVVTTNATMYIDGPPQFDKNQGALNYKVAAPHFEPDGTTAFKGTYDLAMNSKVARCIYGFTSAPVGATISVTSADGTPDIATTVLGEKNGWLSLGAYNFTFSNPTVQVKLSQASAVPTKVVSKKITCVKGKTMKVVTTSTCPAGYKKK
jgi:hypothetical protein